MIEFQPDTDNRTTRVRVVVPDVVQQSLERTYRDTTVWRLPYEDDDDAEDLARMCRVHANRRGLKLHWGLTLGAQGEKLLLIKMRDKRPYTKRSPVWEQRRDSA